MIRGRGRARSSGLPSRPYGVYVHFPWCTLRCPYCDFAVTTARPVEGSRYARAVVSELGLRAPAFGGLRCETLYVGGGTPSLWNPRDLAPVLGAVRALGLAPGAEVTIEANPESADGERARAWRDAGVNRVSIGVQSFDAAVLAKLGRRHGPAAAERAIRDVAAVVPNVSVDLIYGARRSSVATARADAERLATLPVMHVSAYALTLDAELLAEDVPLARLVRAGRLTLPAEDEVLAQADALGDALERAGLRRYEVSNFARPGFESRHNLLYWNAESYLGVGAGAVGCLRADGSAIRWSNHRGLADWFDAVEAGRVPSADEERLSAPQARNERLMLGLRTVRGIEAGLLSPAQLAEARAAVEAGLAVLRDGRLSLTPRGMDVHSALSERLFEPLGAA